MYKIRRRIISRIMTSMCGCGILVLLGCGERSIELVPVRGKVLVGEQPITAGTVSFRPDAGRGNQTMEQPAGTLQSDGGFELFTAERPGAPIGWYRVLVMADNFQVIDPPPSPVWPEYPEGFLPKPLVHERYLYFNQTDATVEVTPNADKEHYVLRLNP